MNMVRIRHILEMRRANKAAPLLPPKTKRQPDECKRQGPKEIIDINIKIRNLRTKVGKSNSVMCIFSESDDNQCGPWRVSATSDVLNKEANIDLQAVFAIEFQFERCQFIKLDLCDWTENSVASLGYTVFSVSELVVCENGAINRKIINDEAGESVAEIQISCTVRPKPHSVVLQFAAKNIVKKCMAPNSAQIFFEVVKEDENCPGQSVVLYRSEVAKHSAKVTFRVFSLQSVDMTDSNVTFVCYFRDAKTQRGTLGAFETNYQQLKRETPTETTFMVMYENSRGQRKSCGSFELLRCNEVALSSFLDYITSGATLNFAVAVDFSRSDQFIDEVFVRRYLDDVDLAVKAVGEPFREFCATSAYPAFGFGAKIPPLYRESQEFCLSLETDPYCRGLDGIMAAFKNSFATVQPITVAHLSHVIYYVSKLAQNALNRSKSLQPTYFTLLVVTRGVFDDLKETIQAIIFASRAPISIVFVGIGDSDLTELERLGTAGTRLNYHGRKPERDCMQYVSLPKCREEESNPSELKALVAEKALSGIPWQMATWATKNGYKPRSAPVAYSTDVQCDQMYEAVPMQCTYRQPAVAQQAGCVFSAQTTTAAHQTFTAVPLRQLPPEPKHGGSHGGSGSLAGVRSNSEAFGRKFVKMVSQMSVEDAHYDASRYSYDPETTSLPATKRAPSSSSLLDEATSSRPIARHPQNMAQLRSFSIQASSPATLMSLSSQSRKPRPEYINP